MTSFNKDFSPLRRALLSFLSRVSEKIQFTHFGYLNITQFLGAMNDNIIKLLIVYCFIEVEGKAAGSSILAAVGAIYVIPFLLFSHLAGILADRFSKRQVIIGIKIMEVATMCLTLLAFVFVSKTLAFTGLFLLAAHSALFGPSKYSIVPELVPQEQISRANGLLTSFSYIAIIIGTFLASFLTDLTNRHYILASCFPILFASIGLYTSYHLPKTPPACSRKKNISFFFKDMKITLKKIRRVPSLTTAVISSSFFLFVGSFVQLNTIPFAMQHLNLSDIQGGYLFLLTALGIGIGSILAGRLSGKTIELGLAPLGGLGMVICCFLLDHYATRLHVVVPLIIGIGIFGGFYVVPIDSFIQVASPRANRGQVLAMVNFFGFAGVLLSTAMFYFASNILELAPKHVFSLIGTATCLMLTILAITLAGYVIRFLSFLGTKVFFNFDLKNRELIPLNTPSFFFVPYSFWPWAMVLLSSQRCRMRLFSLDQAEEHDSKWISFMGKFVQVASLDDPELLMPEGELGDMIAEALQANTSIVFFSSKGTFTSFYQKWITSWQEALGKKPIPFFALLKPPTEEKNSGIKRNVLQAEVTRIG